jgi:hypothetical protein
VLIGTSHINLVLGQIFYRCKVGALELCPAKVGALELCLEKDGALELCPAKVGALESRVT